MIRRNQVHEYKVHHFMASASDLGMAPGEWPETIQTDIGNGQPFLRVAEDVRDEDLVCMIYRQFLGCIDLRILND